VEGRDGAKACPTVSVTFDITSLARFFADVRMSPQEFSSGLAFALAKNLGDVLIRMAFGEGQLLAIRYLCDEVFYWFLFVYLKHIEFHCCARAFFLTFFMY